jgi:hypothetical protein
MEKKYWIGRQQSAMAMARRAASADTRFIHYELAGRYSIMAAQCIAAAESAPAGQRAMLHLRVPAAPRPPASRPVPGIHARTDPAPDGGDGA